MGALLIVVGVLMVMGSAGTSDLEIAQGISAASSTSLWQSALQAAVGMALIWGGYQMNKE